MPSVAKTKQQQVVNSIEELVELLRDAIISGNLMPNERLIEVELTATLDTNRANVRTALALLEREGLVTREPNRGARVRLISDQDAFEIAEARQALESLVARQAAKRATASDRKNLKGILADMERAAKANDFKGFSLQNGKLHEEIRRIAANATVARLLQGLHFHFVRVQYRALFAPGRMEKSLKEHREIVAAICTGEVEKAESAMRTHLSNITESIRWYIDAAIDNPHPGILSLVKARKG